MKWRMGQGGGGRSHFRMASEPPPFLAVMGSCDLRCAWCNYKGAAVVGSAGEVERVGDELARLRALGHKRVGFGVCHTEPTRHPDLRAIVRLARQLGFEEITLSTSGVLLAERAYLRDLRHEGLSCVGLAVVGLDSELSDLLLGCPGAAAAKLRAIENCVSEGLQLYVMTLLLRPALTDLPAAIKEIGKLLSHSAALLHGIVPDGVRGTPLTRVAALWPRYEEVAWLLSRPKLLRGFLVHSSDMPVCARHRIPGMAGAQLARPDSGITFVKPPPTCGRCTDHPECLGVESGYLAAHGSDFTVAGGPREPPRPDIEALRELLAPIVTEDAGGPTPDAGSRSTPGDAVLPTPDAEPESAPAVPRGTPAPAWQTRVVKLLDHARKGQGARLAGYSVRELNLAPGQVLLRMESAADAMELYLELRADAARYFKAGRRLAVSYLPATPPDTPARLRLVGALLRLLDGRV
ncbi:MAG: radical SAM protein [Deltaproteobacteria bacterium]|nr:radical SAM protein [Deltaproteobacteria bacterium]